MAIEIKTTNLNEIEALAKQYLEKAEKEQKADKRVAIEEDLATIIQQYGLISRAECYQKAKDSGDPMKYAIEEFFYPTIRVKEVRDKKNGTITRSIVGGERPIDIIHMHKRLEGIGYDPNWIYMLQKFNYHLTIAAANKIGAKVKKDNFTMDKIAREFEMGKNPCSNTQMLKTLTGIVQAMIGEEYKPTSHDVGYLLQVYANDNKKSKTAVTAANHKTLANYMKKVCHRILNNLSYDLEQKEIKEEK